MFRDSFPVNNRKRKQKANYGIFILLVGIVVLGLALFLIPSINNYIFYRYDIAKAYVRGVINPVDEMPTSAASADVAALQNTPTPKNTPTFTPTAAPPTSTPEQSPTPTNEPTSLPPVVALSAPIPEKQDWNNCGPATLSMYLRFYGWGGDQLTVSDAIKPIRGDKNVNVEELVEYVYRNVSDVEVMFRVGGNIQLMRELISAGIPVMIEESLMLDDKDYWPNDDNWTGHYLLVTGYDDNQQAFYTQNTYFGPDPEDQSPKPDALVPYEQLDRSWQAFNRVYILIYRQEQTETVQAILGDNMDPEINRQNALEASIEETENIPNNAFSWFNLGSNYVYFEDYIQAASAYDKAREIGLPQRMLRYQFGPFLAYFHTGRNEDLESLTTYALKITPDSEEAMLWYGWLMYRKGNKVEARNYFQQAVYAHPGYQDAEYALNYLEEN